MNRRDFLLASAVVTLAMPIAARAASDYSPELLAAELAAGKTVFLDFKASWCSTCAAQERVITALLLMLACSAARSCRRARCRRVFTVSSRMPSAVAVSSAEQPSTSRNK